MNDDGDGEDQKPVAIPLRSSLSEEEWAQVRHAYEYDAVSLYNLTRRFRITRGRIAARRDDERWQRFVEVPSVKNKLIDFNTRRQPVVPLGQVLPPAGSYTKRTAEARKRILHAVRLGASFATAARTGGMSIETLNSWRLDDPGFSEEIEQARAEMEVAQLANIERAAQSDERYWAAAAWKLERILPKVYGRVLNVAPASESGELQGPVTRVVYEIVTDGEVESEPDNLKEGS